jgi:hypothetical protein
VTRRRGVRLPLVVAGGPKATNYHKRAGAWLWRFGGQSRRGNLIGSLEFTSVDVLFAPAPAAERGYEIEAGVLFVWSDVAEIDATSLSKLRFGVADFTVVLSEGGEIPIVANRSGDVRRVFGLVGYEAKASPAWPGRSRWVRHGHAVDWSTRRSP